jgi:hypothetical protein
MTHVEVEIKKAGDGVNYPKKGRTVTIHYAGASILIYILHIYHILIHCAGVCQARLLITFIINHLPTLPTLHVLLNTTIS